MVLEQALNLAGLGTAVALLFIILFFVVMGIFIWIGAYIAGIKKKSFLNSFLAAFLGTVISGLVFFFFGFSGIMALVVSVAIAIFVIKLVFSTNWRRALVAWLFSIIAQIVAVAILVFGLIRMF